MFRPCRSSCSIDGAMPDDARSAAAASTIGSRASQVRADRRHIRPIPDPVVVEQPGEDRRPGARAARRARRGRSARPPIPRPTAGAPRRSRRIRSQASRSWSPRPVRAERAERGAAIGEQEPGTVGIHGDRVEDVLDAVRGHRREQRGPRTPGPDRSPSTRRSRDRSGCGTPSTTAVTCGWSTGPLTRRPTRASSASTQARWRDPPVRASVQVAARRRDRLLRLAPAEQRPEDAADDVLAETRRDDLAAGPDRGVDGLLLRLRGLPLRLLLGLALRSASGRPSPGRPRSPSAAARSRAAAGPASSCSSRSRSSGRRRRGRRHRPRPAGRPPAGP